MTVDGHYPTGFQVKSKTTDGTDPSVEYFRKGSAASHLSVADFDPEYFGSARHLHLSGVAAALSSESLALCHHAAREMRAMGKTISFDPNLRPVLWPSREVMIEQLNQLAFAADWVLPGLKEGQILTGQSTPEGIADFYLERGVQAVIIKTGPDGAWFKTAAGDKAAVAAVKVDNVVDTVGAGDGFAVGTLSAPAGRKNADTGGAARQQNRFAGDPGHRRQRRPANPRGAGRITIKKRLLRMTSASGPTTGTRRESICPFVLHAQRAGRRGCNTTEGY